MLKKYLFKFLLYSGLGQLRWIVSSRITIRNIFYMYVKDHTEPIYLILVKYYLH